MKQKVIVYNADGNSIRYRTTGLEQAREHVFLGKHRSDEYGNHEVEFVLCISGVYLAEKWRRADYAQNESFLNDLENHAVHFKENVLENDNLYPNLMVLEIFRRTGTEQQQKMLHGRRERIIRHREQERERAKEESLRKEEMQKQKHEEEYLKAVDDFKAGNAIPTEWVVEMARRNGIRLHPKTIHDICHHCGRISKGFLHVKDRKRNFEGVFKVVNALSDKLDAAEPFA